LGGGSKTGRVLGVKSSQLLLDVVMIKLTPATLLCMTLYTDMRTFVGGRGGKRRRGRRRRRGRGI